MADGHGDEIPVGHDRDGTKVPKGGRRASGSSESTDMRFRICVTRNVESLYWKIFAEVRGLTPDADPAYFDAIFLTMASTSLRSLSLRLTE